MHRTVAVVPLDLRLRRVAAGSLVIAAVAQLLGQVMLRVSADTWVAAHVVLLLGAVCLLAGAVAIALVIGPRPATWVGGAAAVVGQVMTIVILCIDLDVVSVDVDVIRALDTWDFLAVVGLVVLLLELRRRRPELGLGTNLALVALAVPSVDGLVVVAAVAVVLGFAALAHTLVSDRWRLANVGLARLAVAVFAVAGIVSWQRAALAVVVLAWTVAART